MAGLFSTRRIDPTKLPRIVHRQGKSVLEERTMLLDSHGAEWRVVDYIGGDGRPIEQCLPVTRPPRSTVQYRMFILQPLERSARLYAFDREERRDFTVYEPWRLEGQLARATSVRYPSLRPIDPDHVIMRKGLHKPTR